MARLVLFRLVRRSFALLIPLAVACGDGDAGIPPSDPSIASIVVTGAPSSTLLVGDSVRLIATAVNETGGTVSNQRFAWTSSAPNVAVVRENGTVLAIGAGQAVISARAGDLAGTAALTVAFGTTIGTQGGIVTAAGGTISLSLPAGTLSQPTLVLLRPATTSPADPRVASGTQFELGPDGVIFSRGGTLTMTYEPGALPAGLAAESFQLYTQSGNGWAVVPGSKVDVATRKVTGAVYRSGVYAVRSTPVDHIAMMGAVANGALYAGQSAQLSAALLGAANDSLPARSLAWSSSDAARVSVDATGKVTAVSAGVATITVTTDGKSASATVTVLTRPTANWSRATDWTTYQGNAQHTGFIDATVDPSAFKPRWTVTPIAGASFFPPTIGNGRLFLSQSAYFQQQQLLALDLTDGTRRWARDFGAIYGINQSTYHAGRVYITSGGHEDTYMRALSETDGSLHFETRFDSQWEHWKAPIVVGSTVVTAGGYYGGMYGFDRTTGARLFFLSGSQVDGWAPAGDGALAYRSGGTGVQAVNPLDGKLSFEVADTRLNAVTTPVLGGAADLLMIASNRLISVDLVGRRVRWEQSGTYAGTPVVGGGVVYGFSGTTVAARRQSDGELLWSWSIPAPYKSVQALALTSNVLFVALTTGYGGATATYAVDLASHLTVWSHPLGGDLAIGAQGVLVILQGSTVAAISLR